MAGRAASCRDLPPMCRDGEEVLMMNDASGERHPMAFNCGPSFVVGLVAALAAQPAAAQSREAIAAYLAGRPAAVALAVPGEETGDLGSWTGLIGEDLGFDGSSGFWRIGDTDGAIAAVGESGYEFVCDLAWHPDGWLYAMTCAGELFQMHPSTGKVTFLMQVPFDGVNGLVASPDGYLFASAAGGELLKIDPRTLRATLIGFMPYASSGDLVFDADGTLYASVVGTTTDFLVKVNPATAATTVVGSFGFKNVWGLAFDGVGNLIAAGNQELLFSYRPFLFRVNKLTGAGTHIANLSVESMGGLTWQASPLMRPTHPVVFLHGTCSSGTAWDRSSTALRTRGWRYGGHLTDAVQATGLIPGNSDFYVVSIGDPLIQGGLDAWGLELRLYLDRIKRNRTDGAHRFILVAHSAGGLAARAYLQGSGYQQDVHHLITYGTPHNGTPGAVGRSFVEWVSCPDSPAFAVSQGIREMAPGSAFLRDLNGKTLPDGVGFTSLIGRSTCSPVRTAILGLRSDCVVPTSSQSLASALTLNQPLPVGFKVTSKDHADQTSDWINILWAIMRVTPGASAPMTVQASPGADVRLTDPWGRVVDKTRRGLDLISYEEIAGDDGRLHDVITLPTPLYGRYTVQPVAEASVPAGATYDLSVKQADRTTVMADKAPVSGISATPFEYRAAFSRYLAEGATSSFFRTRIALLNPTSLDASTTVRYQPATGQVVERTMTVPARRRVTVDPSTVLGSAEFSTTIEADQTLVVDRTMTWDSTGFGSHAESSVERPTLQWFLAEGATHSGFDLFYLIQNPNPITASVRIRFLLPAPAPAIERTYSIAPASRFNVWVNRIQGLSSTDVSADISASVPIIVERAMYLSGGRPFGAGHASAGVSAMATRWLLAEGATGSYFDMFILIANPGPTAAQLRVTYAFPAGTTLVKTYVVPGSSRFNIWVDLEDPQLANTAVSATVDSLNGVPVVVERSMWWPGASSTWHEAHNSPGATTTGTSWAFADGEVSDTTGTDTFLLVANASSVSGTVRVTVLYEDRSPEEKLFTVPAVSRTNVDVRREFPNSRGRRFGALVESLGDSPVQIIAERAMYSNAAGVIWAAGTNVVGTRIR